MPSKVNVNGPAMQLHQIRIDTDSPANDNRDSIMLMTNKTQTSAAEPVKSASRVRRRPVVIVAGAIAPYTNRVYEAYGAREIRELRVLVCVDVEPQRKWAMPVATRYFLKIMPGLRRHISDLRNIYFNPTVLLELAKAKPSAILVGSFSPTMVLAGLYAIVTRTPFGVMTDGSFDMDPG